MSSEDAKTLFMDTHYCPDSLKCLYHFVNLFGDRCDAQFVRDWISALDTPDLAISQSKLRAQKKYVYLVQGTHPITVSTATLSGLRINFSTTSEEHP